jgi:hypothetical protein
VKSFSERKGLKKVRTEIQVDSMDMALKNRLWNVLDYYYWSHEHGIPNIVEVPSAQMKSILTKIWGDYFKESVTIIYQWWSETFKILSKRYSEFTWNEVYDFIEFAANNFSDEETSKKFIETCNSVLETELSAYRFVGNKITQITSKEEIAEIEEALESPYKTVNTHLESALKLMSDRTFPDYRNSVKESISAVEAICRIIANDEKATLGKALDIVEKKIGLHGALKKTFDSLYGYTSSAEGIRHSLLEKNVSLSFEDAKFMLVSCSAFVNYLVAKTSKVK